MFELQFLEEREREMSKRVILYLFNGIHEEMDEKQLLNKRIVILFQKNFECFLKDGWKTQRVAIRELFEWQSQSFHWLHCRCDDAGIGSS